MRDYLTPKEVAARRRKTEQALSKERKRGQGPPWIPDGRRILYPADLLEQWLESRIVVPLNEAYRPGGTGATSCK